MVPIDAELLMMATRQGSGRSNEMSKADQRTAGDSLCKSGSRSLVLIKPNNSCDMSDYTFRPLIPRENENALDGIRDTVPPQSAIFDSKLPSFCFVPLNLQSNAHPYLLQIF